MNQAPVPDAPGKKSSLPIGVFDSGIGGLTVVRQLQRVLPREDLVYLGDTARVPYGNKSPETVLRFACEDTQFLVSQNVKAVVVACNTASAWALDALQRRFDLPILGVILPGARAALEQPRHERIGVIGTNATIRSGAYSRAILARCDTVRVFAQACPLLVPLVEEGWTDHPVTERVLREYLRPLRRHRIETLVLGCTHYPLLKEAIQKVTRGRITLVDSAESCALDVQDRLGALRLLDQGRKRRGTIQSYVTDEVARFDELAARFLGQKAEPAQKIILMPAK